MTSTRRLILALAWLAALLVAGLLLGRHLELSGDLRKFMPAPPTPAQKRLIEELGVGPGSRLLLVAVSGSDAETLAAQSNALRDRLAAQSLFKLIANGGESAADAIPAHLRPYRYLLSPTLDTHAFDRAFLAEELAQRVQDMGSPDRPRSRSASLACMASPTPSATP